MNWCYKLAKEFSIQDGKRILKNKGILEEIYQITSNWNESKKNLKGWEFEKRIPVCNGANYPRFDAYKKGVALEHENREQMNLRSHLLMLESSYREDHIDAGVLVVTREADASVDRTKNELRSGIFNKYFPLSIPLFLYEPRK